MDPGCRPHLNPERDVHPDELDAFKPHGPSLWTLAARPVVGPSLVGLTRHFGLSIVPLPRRYAHALNVDASLYDRAFQPGWRNGRRGGLKSRCPKGRAGSSPAPGTGCFPKFSLIRGTPRRTKNCRNQPFDHN